MCKWFSIFIGVLLIPSMFVAGGYDSFKVLKVIDGDTIVVREAFNGRQDVEVQLLGIKAPPIKNENAQTRALSLDAKNYLESLILNKTVKARYCFSESETLFMELYLGDQTINKMLVKNGYAKVNIRKKPKCFIAESSYIQAEEHAKSHRLGIWSENDGK